MKLNVLQIQQEYHYTLKMKINYQEYGFKDAVDFAKYHFNKFSPESQEKLRSFGILGGDTEIKEKQE